MFEMDSNSSSDFMSSSSSSSSSEMTSDSEQEDQPSFVEVIDGYDNKKFKSQMRMQRTTVEYLLTKFYQSDLLPPQIGGGKRKIGHKATLYIFIWYIGSFVSFRQLANLFSVSISTAWRAVHRVTSWIISIGQKYVKWPQKDAAEEAQEKFKEKRKIPGIIGAIGCTNITIKAPRVNKENYFDINKNYSIILQAIVDADEKFIHLSCGEPGVLHYNTVLRTSDLFKRVQSNPSELFAHSLFLLGDSNYPCADWLVTPFKDDGNLSGTQKKFNELHASTRVVVTNAFGLLKARFRRFLKITEQINVNTVSNIIVSACILHNICITKGDHISSYEPEKFDVSSLAEPNDENSGDISVNRRERLYQYLLKNNLLDECVMSSLDSETDAIDAYDNKEFVSCMEPNSTAVGDLLVKYSRNQILGLLHSSSDLYE